MDGGAAPELRVNRKDAIHQLQPFFHTAESQAPPIHCRRQIKAGSRIVHPKIKRA